MEMVANKMTALRPERQERHTWLAHCFCHNGSALFTGVTSSGSNIRRHIIESIPQAAVSCRSTSSAGITTAVAVVQP
jgi:hypothetical protein